MKSTNQLRHILYVSFASKPMFQDDLDALLHEARERNNQCDITGMLLYKNRKFMQLLEGSPPALTDIYEKVRQDLRHYKVSSLLNIATPERSFSNWSMGFCHLDDNVVLDVGQEYSKPLVELDDDRFEKSPAIALKLLLKFARSSQ